MTAQLERPFLDTAEEPARYRTKVFPLGESVPPEAGNLTERAVLLRLSIGAWGINRQLKEHQYEVDANKRMTRAGKKVLVSEELRAIYTRDNACRDWVASRSLPSQMKQGIYLQPVANLLEVDGYITGYVREREGLIDAFLRTYPLRVEEAKRELRSLFDPRNYPPAPTVRKRFRVQHDYLELVTAPGALREVSGELFAREQRKIESRWEEALEEARAVLRSELSGLVDHLVDRLSPAEDGKPKVFRDSLVAHFEDWLSTFSARNLTDDRELSELVERARDLLHPERQGAVSAASLRTDAALRERLQESFGTIRERLDSLVIDRPSRRIRLEG